MSAKISLYFCGRLIPFYYYHYNLIIKAKYIQRKNQPVYLHPTAHHNLNLQLYKTPVIILFSFFLIKVIHRLFNIFSGKLSKINMNEIVQQKYMRFKFLKENVLMHYNSRDTH